MKLNKSEEKTKNKNAPLVLLRPVARVRQKCNLHIKKLTQLRIHLIITLGNTCPNRTQILQDRFPGSFILLAAAAAAAAGVVVHGDEEEGLGGAFGLELFLEDCLDRGREGGREGER